MSAELVIRAMRRAELDTLVEWAAGEGWNPGLHDADVFWSCDPQGFIAAEIGGELIGGGSIVAYPGGFGFMGFFIVRPEHRGQGLGRRLWFHRRDRLRARLGEPATIGMDGVFTMQAFYASGGFVFSHRDLRFEGVGSHGSTAAGLVDARSLPFEDLLAYDGAHFPAPRARFLRAWIAQPGSRALAATGPDGLRGYGVIRTCRQGYKIGPLFAADEDVAESLFGGLADQAAGAPLYLDVPENNPGAMALAARHGMREVFGCARMYLGPPPRLPKDEIFGVTTFELG
ncbi:MAG: GNAT family N-acetyltransferase [Rhodocyclaceae bacterium]|nr:GNAT family N-acetyltransferase [Rhodocyclaceae bacterium]